MIFTDTVQPYLLLPCTGQVLWHYYNWFYDLIGLLYQLTKSLKQDCLGLAVLKYFFIRSDLWVLSCVENVSGEFPSHNCEANIFVLDLMVNFVCHIFFSNTNILHILCYYSDPATVLLSCFWLRLYGSNSFRSLKSCILMMWLKNPDLL